MEQLLGLRGVSLAVIVIVRVGWLCVLVCCLLCFVCRAGEGKKKKLLLMLSLSWARSCIAR